MTSPDACPCDSGRPYDQCCGRWHAGAPAPTPEALMRSRYVAYVRGLTDYLVQTWHPDTCPPPAELASDGVRWLGLTVRAAQSTGPDSATVEFVARSRDRSGRAHRLHERSRFVKRDERWVYVVGDTAPFSDAVAARPSTPRTPRGTRPDGNQRR